MTYMPKQEMRNLLDKILKLPPVEQRVDIRHSWLKRLGLPFPATREKDDMYVYYQALRTALIFNVIVCLPFIFSHALSRELKLGFYTINPGGSSSFIYFFEAWSDIVVSFGVFIFLPFFFIKLCWNVNLKEYDVIWFNSRFPKGRRRPFEIVKVHAGCIVLFAAILKWGHLFPISPYVRPFVSEGTVGMTFIMVFLGFCYAVIVANSLPAIAIVKKYMPLLFKTQKSENEK